jgi:hypothetical protein
MGTIPTHSDTSQLSCRNGRTERRCASTRRYFAYMTFTIAQPQACERRDLEVLYEVDLGFVLLLL